MAIGDFGNNTNGGSNRVFEGTYYSRIRFNNSEDQRVEVAYHGGLMQLSICRKDPASDFKYNAEATIYISMAKAYMLANQISEFMKYREGNKIDPNKAFGIVGGIGETTTYAGFSTNADKDIILTIGKFDNNGVILAKTTFKFVKDYNYSLDWSDINANKFEKVFYNDLEINVIQKTLIDFYHAMNGAAGYGTADVARYDTSKMNGRIDQIFDSLGIERRTYSNNRRNYGNNNFLDSAASSTSRSFEDMEDSLLD